MTSDYVQTTYMPFSAKESKAKLELTREEGFLTGVEDIFDLLSTPKADKLPKDVTQLLQTAYKAIKKADQRIKHQNARIEELEALATRDELTGMMNRRGFFEVLRAEIDRANRDRNDGGLLIMIDLDNFKYINDTFGHAAGDACLKYVADFLEREIRLMDCAARLAGDEFILLFPKTNKDKAMKRAQELALRLNALTMPWKGGHIRITASVGLRDYSAGDQIEDILEDADKNMYEDKRQRKHSVQ